MTLVEIMVAGLILLVAMAGIVPFFLTGLSQASTLRYRSVANNIAREKMEEIRQLDYREIYTESNRVADPTLGTRTLESLFGTSAVAREANFVIAYEVNVSPYDEGYLKEVTVDVSWDAPPAVSAAKITTLVHQQFLGPRGSRLAIEPAYSDPLGTPFSLLSHTNPTTIRYYIAQADWNLVYDNLDTTPVAKEVYLRVSLFDSNGQSISLGDPAADYKIHKDRLRYSTDADGNVDAVWFETSFSASAIPDGYWEMRAVAYNTFDEPGNIWRLMVRTEQDAPAEPTSFAATGQDDGETVILTWAGGAERDREYYVLQRRLWDGADWLPWVTLTDNLSPIASTYTDKGSIATSVDPWGNAATQHHYEYQLYAVDKNSPGLAGAAAVASVVLPPPVTTTTLATTTTLPSTTTTTAAVPSEVYIDNLTGLTYNVVVQDDAGVTVYSGQVKKNKTITVSGLSAGSYLITATSSGMPDVTRSFTVPEQAGDTVLSIL
jgi:Tfp pilus assembly protein PilV